MHCFTVQVIDDTAGNTLCTASTLSKDIRESLNGKNGGNKVRDSTPDVYGPLLEKQCYAYFVLVRYMSSLNPSDSWDTQISWAVSATDAPNAWCAQDAAELVGKRIAQLCLEKNIDKVSFDRGGHIYHGRIKVSIVGKGNVLIQLPPSPSMMEHISLISGGWLRYDCPHVNGNSSMLYLTADLS